MKNIFKMMGIALLACSMVMVSCKKDDDKTDDQGGQGGGQGGNGSITLTWGGEVQNPGYLNTIATDAAQASSNGQLWLLQAAKSFNNGEIEFPNFVLYYFWNGQSADYQNTFGLTAYFQSMWQSYPCEVYESTAYETQTGYTGDYGLDEIAQEQITALDPTALTMTVKYDIVWYSKADVYDAWEEAANASENPETYQPTEAEYESWINNATHKHLVADVQNYKFNLAVSE